MILLIDTLLSVTQFVNLKESLKTVLLFSFKVSANRPFPSSCLRPLQSESKCKVFVMKISFHSYVK